MGKISLTKLKWFRFVCLQLTCVDEYTKYWDSNQSLEGCRVHPVWGTPQIRQPFFRILTSGPIGQLKGIRDNVKNRYIFYNLHTYYIPVWLLIVGLQLCNNCLLAIFAVPANMTSSWSLSIIEQTTVRLTRVTQLWLWHPPPSCHTHTTHPYITHTSVYTNII